jgi:hypothetical protein
MVMLDKIIQTARSTGVAIPNSHNLQSAVTEKLQKYTDLHTDIDILVL